MTVKIANDIEAHRAFWADIARKNDWYQEPFYVQVWQDFDGTITDSVSTRELTQDWVIENDTFVCPACNTEQPYSRGHGDCRACDDCCSDTYTPEGKLVYCYPR